MLANTHPEDAGWGKSKSRMTKSRCYKKNTGSRFGRFSCMYNTSCTLNAI